MSANIIEPNVLDRGSFVGDIFFGDPGNSTRGTHRWDGSDWQMLPTDAETLLVLLSRAREQRDTLLSAMRQIKTEANYNPEHIEGDRADFYARGCSIVAELARAAIERVSPALDAQLANPTPHPPSGDHRSGEVKL